MSMKEDIDFIHEILDEHRAQLEAIMEILTPVQKSRILERAKELQVAWRAEESSYSHPPKNPLRPFRKPAPHLFAILNLLSEHAEGLTTAEMKERLGIHPMDTNFYTRLRRLIKEERVIYFQAMQTQAVKRYTLNFGKEEDHKV